MSENKIFTHNCGFRAFCGRATESGASKVALDNTLATTVDNTYPGAGIVQSGGGHDTFLRFYFSEIDDLYDYYEKRGLDHDGYYGSKVQEEIESLSGDIEIETDKTKVTYEFEDQSVDIDKRVDQTWEEI